MNTPTGPRRPFKIVLALLLVAIMVDQYWVADAIPWLSGLAGINPSVVFLDIPLHLPLAIGLIPVVGIFSLLYATVLATTHKGITLKECRKRIGAVLSGFGILLCCMASGGLAFFWAHDLLPREVRNGIDSFGLHLDLYTPYPDHEVIRLRGGMVMLACFLIGLPFCIRKINRQAAAPLSAEKIQEEPLPVKQPAMKQAPVKRPSVRQPAMQQQSPAKEPAPIPAPIQRRCRVEPLPENAIIPSSAHAVLTGKDRKAAPSRRIYYQPPPGMNASRPTLRSETV